MAHFGLADVIERALSRARLLYYGLSNGCDGLEKTGGGGRNASFLYIEANVHGPLSFQLLVRLSNLSHDGFHTPSA